MQTTKLTILIMEKKELLKIFKAMGNERRFVILKYLLQKKELTVTQISELINLSLKSVSRHLAVLLNANLVEVRQVNINRLYCISPQITKQFLDFLK